MRIVIIQPHSDDAALSAYEYALMGGKERVEVWSVESDEARLKEDEVFFTPRRIPVFALRVPFKDESYYDFNKRCKTPLPLNASRFCDEYFGAQLLEEIGASLAERLKSLPEDVLIVAPLGVGHPFHAFVSDVVKQWSGARKTLFYRDFPHSYKRRAQEWLKKRLEHFTPHHSFDALPYHSEKFSAAKKAYKTQSGFFFYEREKIEHFTTEEYYTYTPEKKPQEKKMEQMLFPELEADVRKDIMKDEFEAFMAKSKVCWPICIPSYNRWERKDNKTLTEIVARCDDEIKKNTRVFVRKEQLEKYQKNFPEITFVTLPEVKGLAGTRQYMTDYMMEHGITRYIDMDDDFTALQYVWHDDEGDHLTRKYDTDFSQILRFGTTIAAYAFDKYGCVFGSFHRQHFANNYPASQTAFQLNQGATARGLMFIDAAKMKELGIRRSLDFDPTGDDMGFVAAVASKKGSMFCISCLSFGLIDDELNSVIRNDSNRRGLAAYEYQQLLKWPIKDYLRIAHTFEDGSYRFSDIDYKRYTQLTGLPSKRVYLDELMGR